MADLSGKVALVTGGSRGIGAAVARRLAADGADVAITFVHSEDAARDMVAELVSGGRRALAIRADAADPEATTAAIDLAAAELDGLDIFVNNAGILAGGPLAELTLADIDQILSVNTRAALLGSQAASRHLRDGGRIVVVGSIGAHWFPQPMGTLYGMSKAALTGLVRGLARDVGPQGVTVNLVEPGPIETDMLDDDAGPMDVPLLPLIAMGRFGKPSEVAALVAFLAGPESGFITGSTIRIDGGITL
ncbi:3-oxoacyl-ACP reductase family protein [Nocardia sp. NPDC051030]|uniref:SDR family NAD(P)-dependent oxidoreductase n=1 Tax=Nocardia sp. NPDC051030 TaxID=3155162 RepID=UPI0034404C7B